jgi:hypothetical protein
VRSRTGERLRIVVGGRIFAMPFQGGGTWAVLQYLLGLEELGHDVHFVEEVPRAHLTSHAGRAVPSSALAYGAQAMAEHGFGDRWSVVCDETGDAFGSGADALPAFLASCDLLVNLGGALRHPSLRSGPRRQVYIDLDPGFTQVWHAEYGIDMGFEGHTAFMTVGSSLGSCECPVPLCGREWTPILPPVVLREWPMTEASPRDVWTTIANWRSYGPVEHASTLYGQKAHSFRQLLDLPAITGERFELALAIHPDERDDLERLDRCGWQLVDPMVVAGTSSSYRTFVQSSFAEIGVAKSGYVASRSGWFSDRSACYLASGRPVVAQDTSIGAALPSGFGLLTFSSVAEAAEAVAEVRSDYRRHAVAAREIAAEFLDARHVLSDFIDRLSP